MFPTPRIDRELQQLYGQRGQRNIVDLVLTINEARAKQYHQETEDRERLQAVHPSGYIALKCMDGRVNFPEITGAPLGFVEPGRAMGGVFRLSWPGFRSLIGTKVKHDQRRGAKTIVFCTYHFSASDQHLGCAGWKYNTNHARMHQIVLARSLKDAYNGHVCPIVLGVETDLGELVFEGEEDACVHVGHHLHTEPDGARAVLTQLYPRCDDQIIGDIVPFYVGNSRRIGPMVQEGRRFCGDPEHNERVIAVGMGFSWLAASNFALIIQDSSSDLDGAVRVAGEVLAKKAATLASGDDLLVHVSYPYRDVAGPYPGSRDEAAVAAQEQFAFVLRELAPTSFTSAIRARRVHGLVTVKRPDMRLEVLHRFDPDRMHELAAAFAANPFARL